MQRFMTDALAGRPPLPLPGDAGPFGGFLVAGDGTTFPDDPGIAPSPGQDFTPFGGLFRRLFGG